MICCNSEIPITFWFLKNIVGWYWWILAYSHMRIQSECSDFSTKSINITGSDLSITRIFWFLLRVSSSRTNDKWIKVFQESLTMSKEYLTYQIRNQSYKVELHRLWMVVTCRNQTSSHRSSLLWLTDIFVTFQFAHLENISLCRTILAWIARVEMTAGRLMTVGNWRAPMYIVPRVNGRSI